MPRANRYHLPQYVWHITHRCHRQQSLLKCVWDRPAWSRWLYATRKRFGLCWRAVSGARTVSSTEQ
jgi:putative transposase